MPKWSRKRDLELSMPTYVPPTKSAKHTTAGKARSPKSAKPSDTAAGKAWSHHTAAAKAWSLKSAKPSDTAAGKARSPHTAAAKAWSPKSAKPSNTAARINIPASETPFGIKDSVLRELIGLGKVQVVTRSSKLSRFGK